MQNRTTDDTTDTWEDLITVESPESSASHTEESGQEDISTGSSWEIRATPFDSPTCIVACAITDKHGDDKVLGGTAGGFNGAARRLKNPEPGYANFHPESVCCPIPPIHSLLHCPFQLMHW